MEYKATNPVKRSRAKKYLKGGTFYGLSKQLELSVICDNCGFTRGEHFSITKCPVRE